MKPTLLALGLGAVVAASAQGKGVVPDDHPLSVSGALGQQAFHDYLGEPDVILAIGSELAPTNFVRDRAAFTADLIRVDIDPQQLMRGVLPEIGICSDAAPALAALAQALSCGENISDAGKERAAALRAEAEALLPERYKLHRRVMTHLLPR